MSQNPHQSLALLGISALLLCACQPLESTPTEQTSSAKTPSALHVPSPDWRDQIIYFVMIDRFNDGNASNNDQRVGVFDPNDGAKYSGGDLAGIRQRIDYIKGLGATTLWITPPVANQWWDGSHQYGGYHGYWAEHFKEVDAHYGTLDDYRELSRALHSAGMYLVQDVVVNHTGNFFRYNGPYDAEQPTKNFDITPNSIPVSRPRQWPFSLNDVRDPEHRQADIYHWTPTIVDYSNPVQEQHWQLANLDDLNTDNPVVRKALRDSYGYWIREVGVDGFRIDTAFYVTPEYFADFLHAEDSEAPGVLKSAEQTGRRQFHVFGEGFGIDRAFEDKQARKIDAYMQSDAGQPLLPGMINFPLYGTIQDVFVRGRPTSEMTHRIRSMMSLHQRPHLMPTFVDNHDVDRFLSAGDLAALKQSLALIMTLPGIPTIYYGTEQAFTEPRAAMFAEGYRSGNRDHFDTKAPMYRFIQQLTQLRKQYPALSRGTPTVIADNAASSGALAYLMQHEQQTLLVLFNTANHETLIDNAATGLLAGTRMRQLFGIEENGAEPLLDNSGLLNAVLPARDAQVWLVEKSETTNAEQPSTITLNMAPLLSHQLVGDLLLHGQVKGTSNVQLVVDGDLSRAQMLRITTDGHWQAEVSTASMVNPAQQHRVVLFAPETGQASNAETFTVNRQWQPLISVSDPKGDDHGPSGNYRYPTDPSWGDARALDIRKVAVFASGGALKVDIELNDLIAAWNPVNGFDHLVLTLFIEMPNRPEGISQMPLQNAQLANAMRWHYRLRAHGWSNAFFSSETASATHEGRAISPGADIAVDWPRRTISFAIPASAIGYPLSLSGAKLLVNTWDYGEGYKPLQAEAGPHAFGGGDGKSEPLWMDQSKVITLP